jgi:hypothetical protein
LDCRRIAVTRRSRRFESSTRHPTTEVDLATIENATEIRPFRVEVPQQEIDELRRRMGATRWPEGETVADGSQGGARRSRQR